MSPPTRFFALAPQALGARAARLSLRWAIPSTSQAASRRRRPFSSSARSLLGDDAPSAAPFSFGAGPAPPRLPPAEQAEFERLQREAAGAPGDVGAVVAASTALTTSTAAEAEAGTTKKTSAPAAPPPAAQLFSGGIRKGAPPEFAGDRNPRTGEEGGPRNEPLRWGGRGDWSYNGRVTDF